ncbi:MAG: 50S ribosomal protein L23 [Nitrospirales bacterium]|nr:MAG: 50S ribosomal protein L23 [Nitrospirales bacterium]
MTLNPYDILIRPLLTEKITNIRDSKNCVSFIVSRKASRIDIGLAVEAILKVKVEAVNVMNVKGKPKRQGRFIGRRPHWKKAIVTLKEGEKVDLYESA